MHFGTLTALSCLLGGALSSPVNEKRCVGWGYGTFYNDHHCRQNGGIAVSMNNDGCLANQINRNSIYIQEPCSRRNNGPSLVWSPGRNCNCQNNCRRVPRENNNFCWNLGGNPGAQSFRFIMQGCGGNNC